MKYRIVSASLLLFLAYPPPSSHALVVSGPDILPDFQFSNPGARSNAMGGAFIGVADDATAAFANPAGLTILTKPESSLEFKSSTYTSKIYLENGQKYEFDHTSFDTSFIGYAAPHGKTALAFYRHQIIDLNQKTEKISFTPDITTRLVDTTADIKAATYGAAFAAKPLASLALGMSVGFTTLDYYYRSTYVAATNQGDYGTNSQIDTTTSAQNYTASLLYSPIEAVSIGVVYRYGPEMEISSSGQAVKNMVNIPDVYGAGLSWRIGNNLTVAADVNRVMYSDLLDEFYFYDSTVSTIKNPWTRNTGQFTVADATEIHAGFEYMLPFEKLPLALRGGYFKRPDHTIYYTDTKLPYLSKFKKGEDDNIFSLGLGMVLGDNGQVDFAASKGDQVEEYILSMVYRF